MYFFLCFFYNHFLPMRGWGIICLLLDFCWKQKRQGSNVMLLFFLPMRGWGIICLLLDLKHLRQGSNLKDKDRVQDEHDGPLLRKENVLIYKKYTRNSYILKIKCVLSFYRLKGEK